MKSVLDYLRQEPPLLWLGGYLALVILIALGVGTYKYGWRAVGQVLWKIVSFPLFIVFCWIMVNLIATVFGMLWGAFIFLKGFWLLRDYKWWPTHPSFQSTASLWAL